MMLFAKLRLGSPHRLAASPKPLARTMMASVCQSRFWHCLADGRRMDCGYGWFGCTIEQPWLLSGLAGGRVLLPQKFRHPRIGQYGRDRQH
jgi:hypothetical protein